MDLRNCWVAAERNPQTTATRRDACSRNVAKPNSSRRLRHAFRNPVGFPDFTVIRVRQDFFERCTGDLRVACEHLLTALREKPLKAFEIMKRVNISNQEDCQSLLLKMRDEGAVKFDIHKGYWHVASQQ